MTKTRYVTGTITLDLSKFNAAIGGVIQSVAELGEKTSELYKSFRHVQVFSNAQSRAIVDRMRFGPRNLTTDGSWQTDMCACWLHDSCQAPGICDCNCHGGTLTGKANQ